MTTWEELLAIFSIAVLAACILSIPLRMALARLGIVDLPNPRSSHRQPTIRGGGVSIVCVVLVAIAVEGGRVHGIFAGFAIPVALLAAISFRDDFRSLPAGYKLGTQFAVAALGLSWIYGLNTIHLSALGTFRLAAAAILAAVGIVGSANAFNFMDGIDGIAGLQGTIVGLGTAALALVGGVPPLGPPVVISIALAGAALGFLPHNFPRATLFMGDVGSAPLGFALALLAAWIVCTTHPVLIIAFAALHANFVVDTGITLIRRCARSEKIHLPHRDHFYQRAVRAGYTHAQVATTVALLQIILAVVNVAVARNTLRAPALAWVLITTVVVWGLACWWSNSAFNRATKGRVPS